MAKEFICITLVIHTPVSSFSSDASIRMSVSCMSAVEEIIGDKVLEYLFSYNVLHHLSHLYQMGLACKSSPWSSRSFNENVGLVVAPLDWLNLHDGVNNRCIFF